MPDGVNIQVAVLYDGSGATIAAQGLDRLGKSAEGLKAIPVAVTGAEKVEAQFDRLKRASDSFLESIKAGVGIDVGRRIVDTFAEIPNKLREAVARGVEFNTVLESSQLSLAATFRQFRPEQFGTVQSALGASAGVLEQLKVKSLESTSSFQSLASALAQSSGLFAAANIPISKQADLLVTASNAAAGLGLSQEQLGHELRGLIAGEIDQETRIASTLKITREQIQVQQAQGTQYEFLKDKLKGFAEAGKLAGETFAGAKSNLNDTLDIITGKAFEPVFEAMREQYLELAKELKKDEVVRALSEIGVAVGKAVAGGAHLLEFAVRNAEALKNVAEGAKIFAAAIAAVKIAEFVASLALKAAALAGVTTNLQKETREQILNTAETERNTRARALNAEATAAQRAAGGSGLVGPTGLPISSSAGAAGPTAAAAEAAAGGSFASRAFGAIANAAGPGIFLGELVAGIIKTAGVRYEANAREATDKVNTSSSAVGTAAERAKDALTEEGFQARSLAIREKIAENQRYLNTQKTFEFTETQGIVEGLTAEGETISNLNALLEKQLVDLAAQHAGGRDSYELAQKQVELERTRALLTGDALKASRALALEVNEQKLKDVSPRDQAAIFNDTRRQQLEGARERLTLLNVERSALDKVTLATELLGVANQYADNDPRRVKILEEAKALFALEERLKGINAQLREENKLRAEAPGAQLAADKAALPELEKKIAAQDRSTAAGEIEYQALLQDRIRLLTRIQDLGVGGGALRARLAEFPTLQAENKAAADELKTIPLGQSDEGDKRRRELQNSIHLNESIGAATALPIFGALLAGKADPTAGDHRLDVDPDKQRTKETLVPSGQPGAVPTFTDDFVKKQEDLFTKAAGNFRQAADNLPKAFEPLNVAFANYGALTEKGLEKQTEALVEISRRFNKEIARIDGFLKTNLNP